jgi:hypothetical protein
MSNTAAENLKQGEAIYNEQDGLLSENIFIKIDHLQNDDIHRILTDFVNNGKSYQTFERLIIEK